ncbi:MAG: hypothetical protein LBE61_23175, partial [Burkholderiaceae bacterium]|nr:hypothetical protein [Burkholderiaceae bacterium]
RAAGAKRVLPWVLRRLFGDFLRAQKVTAPPGALPASVLKKDLSNKTAPKAMPAAKWKALFHSAPDRACDLSA